MTPRDCKHGQLARSCEICQLERDLAVANASLADYKLMKEQDLADYQRLEARLTAANKRAERAEADAKRYRWLREPGRDNVEVTMLVDDDPPHLEPGETAWYGLVGQALDVAIDAALADQEDTSELQQHTTEYWRIEHGRAVARIKELETLLGWYKYPGQEG